MKHSVYKIKYSTFQTRISSSDRRWNSAWAKTWAKAQTREKEPKVGKWLNLVCSAIYKHKSLLAKKLVVQNLLNYKQLVTFQDLWGFPLQPYVVIHIFIFVVSQNHRMVEIGRTFGCHLVQAQAGSPRTGFPGPSPDGFWISPRWEAPQPLWASAQSPPQ